MPPVPVPDPPLADDAVALRPWRDDDVRAVVAACQDPLIARYTLVPSPYTERDARAWLASNKNRRSRGEQLELAVTATGGALLGSIALNEIDWNQPRARLGYWVARDERGRGVATRAVSLLSRWALEELGLARLELRTETENVASQRVAERSGFVREGVLRSYMEVKGRWVDCVMFSLVPGDLHAAGASPDRR
jgi:RimJ/RimL family protein N-acetyltransferase